jgi:uroporphyrin-III C-methyltransferase/precorrin-2 dehydrogenase/sirohydrochlorin ferrochelatase
VAGLLAARSAAGHGVVRIAAADSLADRARELEAAGVTFEIVPGVIDGGA